jgi:hypothetical protein
MPEETARMKIMTKRAAAAALIATASIVASVQGAHATSPVGTFILKNEGWGYCLTGFNAGPGYATSISPCNGSALQKWTTYPIGDEGFGGGPYYEVVNVATGLCLSTDGNETGGARVETDNCNSGEDQRWGAKMQLSYYQHLKNLGAYSQSWNDRFQLDMNTYPFQRLWSQNSSPNQVWSWFAA